MKEINIQPHEMSLLRKILPIICLLVPWEVYYYTGDYSSGWGIKFSLFYANFDMQYGSIFVDLIKQLGLLSYGGFLPSIRTITWFLAAALCLILAIYELSREDIELKLGKNTIAAIFIACSVLSLISSMAVWNSSFKTIPIAPLFFAMGGYILLYAKRSNQEE
ncbi:hypothetical protein V7O66_11280 [Methanolobus sp. ZRKC3]|uniref:hypothetical protein n=1 Tax=Methanolobus sp. ZRKC3 TaxID=3125786 RepID=UPI003254B6C7